MAATGRGHAVDATFRASINGNLETVTAEMVTLQNVPYVSLRLITEELGGSYNIQTTRTRVDIAGATAWVESNNDVVSALTTFSLTHPILHRNGDVLIATVDVPLFFKEGFQVSVEQQTRTQASPPSGNHSSAILRRPIRVIVIDAGHGGLYEPGVEGPGGLVEKDLTLAVGVQLQQLLSASIAQQVVLTRNEDSGLSLHQRAASAKNAKGDLLVSIHCGGSFSPSAAGMTLYYPPPQSSEEPRSLLMPYDISRQSEEIATLIADSLRRATSAVVDRIHPAPCAILNASEMPGVLIEIGYLTNPAEEADLGNRSYQKRIAEGISAGIAAYLNRYDSRRDSTAIRDGASWSEPLTTPRIQSEPLN
jgi:N-acetylmuramoyl-L-alanine amidase